MAAATRASVAGIIADCGGCAICATCHHDPVEGNLPDAAALAAETTEFIAQNTRPTSRLPCQFTATKAMAGLVGMRVNDVYAAGRIKERASVTQSKTRKPVRFEITDRTRVSLAKPSARQPAPVDTAICPDHARLGSLNRAGTKRPWPPFDAAHQGCPDLQEDRQPAHSPTVARPYQDGQHYALSRR